MSHLTKCFLHPPARGHASIRHSIISAGSQIFSFPKNSPNLEKSDKFLVTSQIVTASSIQCSKFYQNCSNSCRDNKFIVF